MKATINGREYEVTKVDAIEGALAADLIDRGFEAAFYTMTGKLGASFTALRSVRYGTFSKF